MSNKDSVHVDDSDNNSNTKNKKVVVVKNYPARNLTASIFSLPFLVLASAVFSIPLLAFGKLGMTSALLLTIVAEISIVLLALNYVDALKKKIWFKKLRLNNFKWWSLFIGVGIGALMYFLLQGLAIVMGNLGMPIESSDTSVAVTQSTGISYIIASFILVPFVVPFVEEVFFRGYVLGFAYDSMKEKGKKKAVIWGLIISSIVFSLAHFQGLSDSTDIFLLIWIGFMALVNGALFLKTQSIYTSFALHLAYNGLTVLVPIVFAGL